MFAPATKTKARARVAIIGPAGGGKTFTALRIASAMGQRIALIDTERGSASKYANLFKFDTVILESHSPELYMQAIETAGRAGYDTLIIDSLTHAWNGKNGALEQVDQENSKGGNAFAGWRKITPKHNALVDSILASPCHVIATMRVKTEWVVEENEKGKKVPRKIGLAPVQRDGVEYEFDVVADINSDHVMFVTKTRCPELDGFVGEKAGPEIGEKLVAWLSDGADAPKSAAGAQSAPPISTNANASNADALAAHSKEAAAFVQQNVMPQSADSVAKAVAEKANADAASKPEETKAGNSASAPPVTDSSPAPSSSPGSDANSAAAPGQQESKDPLRTATKAEMDALTALGTKQKYSRKDINQVFIQFGAKAPVTHDVWQKVMKHVNDNPKQ